MARVAVCLALIAPAAGLVAPAAPAASTALKAEAAASLKGMSGGVQAGDPMPGEGPWDPIGFSKLHENIQGSEHAGVIPSQQWMREAEIKHGRVAMLATIGYTYPEMPWFAQAFPGDAYAHSNPIKAALAVPPEAWAQVLLFCGVMEWSLTVHKS